MKKTAQDTQSRWRKITPFELTSFDQETPHGRSITVPDQSTDLKTILAKFTTGEIARLNDYPTEDNDAQFNDLDIESFQRMELSEQADFLANARETLEAFEQAKKIADKKNLEKNNTSENQNDEPLEVKKKPRNSQENEENKKPQNQSKNED